jgi:hypothetical protein
MSRDEVKMGLLGEERGPKGLDLAPDEILELVHRSCKVGTSAE